MKFIKIAAQILWVLFWTVGGTVLGASLGWANHGLPGAIVTGIIGFGVGALLAVSPSATLSLFG
jgi:hypothetical protein